MLTKLLKLTGILTNLITFKVLNDIFFFPFPQTEDNFKLNKII